MIRGHTGYSLRGFLARVIIILLFTLQFFWFSPTKVYSNVPDVPNGLYVSSQISSKDHDFEPSPDWNLIKVSSTITAAEYAPPVSSPPTPVQKPSVANLGTCQDWMNEAGITDQYNAYKLIMRESGCNPNAVNGSSGACGIGQQLPCGKWPHTWNDPIGGLIDMQVYVFAVYGSWANAWQHEVNFSWY